MVVILTKSQKITVTKDRIIVPVREMIIEPRAGIKLNGETKIERKTGTRHIGKAKTGPTRGRKPRPLLRIRIRKRRISISKMESDRKAPRRKRSAGRVFLTSTRSINITKGTIKAKKKNRNGPAIFKKTFN